MDLERPHRSNSINNSSSSSASTTGELFICFTSMKLSSKSILSPGRAREPSQISLSSSVTRRLKSNDSMKGGAGQASPMFTTNGKKRGCAFENPEPSSPKVTCIGQVRVKTKKQGKKFRACGSKRGGEVSFRKVENVNVSNGGGVDHTSGCQGHVLSSNKKWVHLPMTICEALRGFGAEFNCFLPCRSSCVANQRDREEKGRGSSCGTVCARWLVAVQEEEGKGREIELVVGGGGEVDDERRESGEMMLRSSQRRHVFEDIVINDFGNKTLGDDGDDGGEAAGRVSICIPPKNALLLMRCRSDPVKMAALANKFWETPLPKNKEQEQEDEQQEAENGSVEKEEEESKVESFEEAIESSEVFVSCEATDEQEIPETEAENGSEEKEEEESKVESFEEAIEASEVFVSYEATKEQEIPETEAETEAESVLLRDETETVTECEDQDQEIEVKEDQQKSKEETLPQVSFDLDKLQVEEEVQQEAEAEDGNRTVESEEEAEEEEESSTSTEEEEETETTQERPESEPDPESESKEETVGQEKILPDCLLFMMCEPKLSMEVSKETWVCSTDFIRCVPAKKKDQHHQNQPEVKQKNGGDQHKARISIDRNPAPILLHPPRSSCHFPAAPPMTTAAAAGIGGTTIDKNLVGGKGYETFVLTRCKSEPRRSSAKLAPDACFWKNRKLEPAALGVGTAGVGF